MSMTVPCAGAGEVTGPTKEGVGDSVFLIARDPTVRSPALGWGVCGVTERSELIGRIAGEVRPSLPCNEGSPIRKAAEELRISDSCAFVFLTMPQIKQVTSPVNPS